MRRPEPYKTCHLILQANAQTNTGSIWLGDFSAAKDKRFIKANNIKTVITAAAGLKVSYPAGIIHKIFQLYDCQSQNIQRYFQEAFEIIQQGLNNGNVYIHCFAGVSRSATILISYLMKKFQWSFLQAFQFTKKRRRFIDPNPGFIKQLRRYQKTLQLQPIQKKNPTETTQVTKQSPTKSLAKVSFMEGFSKYKHPVRNMTVQKQNKTTIKKIIEKSGSALQDLTKIYLNSSQKKNIFTLKKGVDKLPQILS